MKKKKKKKISFRGHWNISSVVWTVWKISPFVSQKKKTDQKKWNWRRMNDFSNRESFTIFAFGYFFNLRRSHFSIINSMQWKMQPTAHFCLAANRDEQRNPWERIAEKAVSRLLRRTRETTEPHVTTVHFHSFYFALVFFSFNFERLVVCVKAVADILRIQV